MFSYTPKRLFAFVEITRKRLNYQNLELFNISRVAYHGDKKHVKELVKAYTGKNDDRQ